MVSIDVVHSTASAYSVKRTIGRLGQKKATAPSSRPILPAARNPDSQSGNTSSTLVWAITKQELKQKMSENDIVDIWMCTKCYETISHSHCLDCDLEAWSLGRVIKYMMEHGQWLQDNIYTYPVTSQPLQD